MNVLRITATPYLAVYRHECAEGVHLKEPERDQSTNTQVEEVSHHGHTHHVHKQLNLILEKVILF